MNLDHRSLQAEKKAAATATEKARLQNLLFIPYPQKHSTHTLTHSRTIAFFFPSLLVLLAEANSFRHLVTEGGILVTLPRFKNDEEEKKAGNGGERDCLCNLIKYLGTAFSDTYPYLEQR